MSLNYSSIIMLIIIKDHSRLLHKTTSLSIGTVIVEIDVSVQNWLLFLYSGAQFSTKIRYKHNSEV